eukprot:CAMPEP_0119546602 /NCGR_PEP_ID=MMETSP1352-20130426/950_1 /TAXON_ID=265584 /ORGANISM="Stauroneis constricta, Strain CCMP1120" /LENGTH=810 /DNA_ID=CAMNT_0007591321 /DNA_START=39 /DNA_END=2471 /DNA_ORIENTATION=-
MRTGHSVNNGGTHSTLMPISIGALAGSGMSGGSGRNGVLNGSASASSTSNRTGNGNSNSGNGSNNSNGNNLATMNLANTRLQFTPNDFDPTPFPTTQSTLNKRRQQQQQQQQQRQQQQSSSSLYMSTYAASLLSTQSIMSNNNVGGSGNSNNNSNNSNNNNSNNNNGSQSRSRAHHSSSLHQYHNQAQPSRIASSLSSSLSASSRHRHQGTHASNGGGSSSRSIQIQQQQQQQPQEAWMVSLKVKISGLSLEPMSGVDIITRLECKTNEVMTRYLPCVDFLVTCQQELRKGLAAATQKRIVHQMLRDSMTPNQFHQSYISPLPQRFYKRNKRLMTKQNLDAAVKEISKLSSDAKGVGRQGCESMKNTFLGGMKDGESWGLRKWLSKNGGALQICNDCECILHACQKLDREASATSKLAERLRPLAKRALHRLKTDVPSSYQEVSTAHPYLPFFHRLESALRGLSAFDPDDDDVICIDDDDEIEEIKAAPPKPKPKKRQRAAGRMSAPADPPAKRAAVAAAPAAAAQPPPAAAAAAPVGGIVTLGDDDNDSIIEILDGKPSAIDAAAGGNDGVDRDSPFMAGEFLNFFAPIDEVIAGTTDPFELDSDGNDIAGGSSGYADAATDLTNLIDVLVMELADGNRQAVRPRHFEHTSFWSTNASYSVALNIFGDLLRSPGSEIFIESIDEDINPSYRSVIKHPLCFRDIVNSLIVSDAKPLSGRNGRLPPPKLIKWNMWNGSELLQAIDLVLLNNSAYSKVMHNQEERNRISKLRKMFWASIKQVLDGEDMTVEERKFCTPTKRGETSGFVVLKK